MLAILVLFTVFCAQVIGPVRSEQSNVNYLLADLGSLFEGSRAESDELQLFQRGLGEDGNENSNDLVPKLDTKKAILAIGKVQPKTAKNIISTLSQLTDTLEDSLFSQLFGHLRYLLQNQNQVRQYPKVKLPPSDAVDQAFNKEGLILATEKLSDKEAEKIKDSLETIMKFFKKTEMETLLSNILQLVDKRESLQKYAQLSMKVDKAFGMDKPLDIASLGLPIPTEENPEVYFRLVDDKHPSVRYLVKTKIDGDSVVQTVLIRIEDNRGNTNNMSNSYTAPNDKKSIEDLYRKLPISRLARH